MRKSGILCPISSLPSNYGIGTLGKSAYEFVDFLKKSGQSYWQILPLGQTGYGDSPYQSFSTFAGNPYFIDLDELREEGLLTITECEQVEVCANKAYIDYEKMYFSRYKVLRKAFARFDASEAPKYDKFVKKNQNWLPDYALFMAVKDHFGGKSYTEWDEDIRLHKKNAIAEYNAKLADDVAFYVFLQYYFNRQWKKLKKYANKKGVSIIGDIPIYVAFDSADTWSNPKLFQLDADGFPTGVAGCPPDAFSATGQLWGNPLYDWKYHKETKYAWWMERIGHCYKLYDMVRIDHFRGFEAYYSIPYGDKTAEFGHWEKGPGYSLFARMKEVIGDKPVIAEDLGFLTKEVYELVAKTGYPGMKIVEFAFNDYEDNTYLPHNYEKNSIVYTGTHDNETLAGWIKNLTKTNKQFIKDYTLCKTDDELQDALIRLAMMSASDTCVIPIQDYLGLDNSARMNIPSTLGDNWKWRLVEGQTTDALAERIYAMTEISYRLADQKRKKKDQKKANKAADDKKVAADKKADK